MGRVDIKKALSNVLNDEKLKQFVVSMNTNEQLFDEGEDSRGIKLDSIGGEYSPFTKDNKLSLGLPIDRVTLFQTGDFYESFNVRFELPYLIITANDQKENVKLNEEWGGFVIGLNEENKRRLENIILERVFFDIFSSFLQ